MTDHDKATAMYKLYLEGYSLEQVGRAFGVKRQTVWEAFKRRGWKTRSPRKLPPDWDGHKIRAEK